jgi:hypothetical protein
MKRKQKKKSKRRERQTKKRANEDHFQEGDVSLVDGAIPLLLSVGLFTKTTPAKELKGRNKARKKGSRGRERLWGREQTSSMLIMVSSRGGMLRSTTSFTRRNI